MVHSKSNIEVFVYINLDQDFVPIFMINFFVENTESPRHTQKYVKVYRSLHYPTHPTFFTEHKNLYSISKSLRTICR